MSILSELLTITVELILSDAVLNCRFLCHIIAVISVFHAVSLHLISQGQGESRRWCPIVAINNSTLSCKQFN